MCLIQDDVAHRLIEHPEMAADLEVRTLTAYIHQCTAEAQEGRSEVNTKHKEVGQR